MKFLSKLYSNDYFGIGLFIVITILAFSFLVILFFGKKDEKARNAENNDFDNETLTNIELPNNQTELINGGGVTPSVDAVAVQPTVAPVVSQENIGSIASPMMDVNSASMQQMAAQPVQQVNMNVVDTVVPVVPEVNDNTFITDVFSLDTLGNINTNNNVNNVSNGINGNWQEPVMQNVTPVMEPNVSTPFYMNDGFMNTPVAPIIEETLVENIFTAPIVEERNTIFREEPIKRPPMSQQFSSVYLNREENPQSVGVNPQPEIKQEPIVEQVVPVVKEVAPLPVKPDIELPKTIDLPKLNKPATNNMSRNSSIMSQLNEKKQEALNNIFANIEEETYTIKE